MKGFENFKSTFRNTWINHSCCNGFGRFVAFARTVLKIQYLNRRICSLCIGLDGDVSFPYVVGKRTFSSNFVK